MSAMEPLHVIVAGAKKCGTTSLFRYLSSHPDVCPSRVKELDYFKGGGVWDVSAYRACFRPAAQGSRPVYLEASPEYLDQAPAIAPRIRRALPDARLIFVLRDPVQRFVSDVRYQQRKSGRIASELDLNDVVRTIAPGGRVVEDRVEALAGPLVEAVTIGRYAERLEPFLDAFGPAQVFVGFLEELGNDPATFMRELCQFLGLSAACYASYPFAVENRGRNVKYVALNRHVERLTLALEPFFNRFPATRRLAREVYHRLNPEVGEAPAHRLEPAAAALLARYYQPSVAALQRTMRRHYPTRGLPAWLHAQEETADGKS